MSILQSSLSATGGFPNPNPNHIAAHMTPKVRGAVFSILQSYLSATAGFPAGSRWLDLFSGTGAVGLEGMSRGCDEAHFVEADPWVVERCLGKNIAACGAEYHTTVHTQFVEAFLRRVQDAPDSVGGAFDFISVTPPYEKVRERRA